jgi:hypothetical protein
MKRGLIVLTVVVVLLSNRVDAGSIKGQAKDLFNNNVSDVTITLLNAQGVEIQKIASPAGSYDIPLNGFSAGNQAVIAVFDAPDRVQARVPVSTEFNNNFNVALPQQPQSINPCPQMGSCCCSWYSARGHHCRRRH